MCQLKKNQNMLLYHNNPQGYNYGDATKEADEKPAEEKAEETAETEE